MAKNTRWLSILWLLLVVSLYFAECSDGNSTVTTPDDVDHQDHGGHGAEHGNQSDHHGNHTGDHGGHHGIHVARWNYEYVEAPFVIVHFLVVVAICQLGFHHATFISSKVPESCLLIILGTLVGVILRYTPVGKDIVYRLEPRTFFLFLLPQIILESAYSLHDRVFFDNLGTILLYAVIGTLFNWIVLGPVLYGLALVGAMGSFTIAFLPCMVFSALIVAVDPVAVLAIFQEIGVNNVLYFLVFGESLLNDAVTVVLYNAMNALAHMEEVTADQIFLAVASFFTISLGGLSIGIIYGFITSFLTKFTEKVRVVEPLAMFTLAYGSYLTAELFHFSGIISIIGCGLVQAQYAFHNIGHKSLTTVKYFSKMLSSASDSVIFLFLGISLASSQHEWNTGFVLWTLLLCLVIRFIGVFTLSFIANKGRLRTIDYEEQFIMAYGGLRGAVAFSLVAMLEMPEQNIFETTTLVVILFTVFFQGMTIKPLVKALHIKTAGHKSKDISVELNTHVVDHLVAGIEEILGHFGRNAVREFIDHYDDKYLKHWFQRNPQSKDDLIMEMYQNLTLKNHYEAIQKGEVYGFTNPMSIGEDDPFGVPEIKEPTPAIMMPGATDPSDKVILRRKFERGTSLDVPSSDLSHRTLDVERNNRRRKSDTAIPNQRKGSSSGADREANRPRFLSQKSSEGPPGFPYLRKKRSTLARLFSREDSTEDGVKANPTAADLRGWIVRPVRQSLGQKYDKNLINDHESDLVHHLDQKDQRLKRMLTANLRQSTMSSLRSMSPIGSQENIDDPRRSTRFETIAEVRDQESLEKDEENSESKEKPDCEIELKQISNQTNQKPDTDHEGDKEGATLDSTPLLDRTSKSEASGETSGAGIGDTESKQQEKLKIGDRSLSEKGRGKLSRQKEVKQSPDTNSKFKK